MDRSAHLAIITVLVTIGTSGCQSPYYADRGALFGGLLGAGTGAVVGHALGNTAAGAIIGAGAGALTGAAVGQGMDDIEARNRAAIAAQLGREIQPGSVSMDDVIAMTHAGVSEELIVNHVRANGVVRPPSTQDLITMQQQGVTSKVIAAMQEPPRTARRETVYVERPAVRPVIVETYHYDPWCYGPYYRMHMHGCW